MAVVSIGSVLLFWQLATQYKLDAYVRFNNIPTPAQVLEKVVEVNESAKFATNIGISVRRILLGFAVATLLGVGLGVLIGRYRWARGLTLPAMEVFRPIPAIAWVPMSIMLWPSNEVSIVFITFLGAFYTIVINVLGGARSIDVRYFQAAQSMGSSRWDIFRRVILPGTLPSIVVGSAVGMGITWEVVVAAEMISGGGSQQAGVGGGLGFFIWNSYVGGSYEQIVVGMISIGIAGFVSSELLRWGGRYATPWLRQR